MDLLSLLFLVRDHISVLIWLVLSRLLWSSVGHGRIATHFLRSLSIHRLLDMVVRHSNVALDSAEIAWWCLPATTRPTAHDHLSGILLLWYLWLSWSIFDCDWGERGWDEHFLAFRLCFILIPLEPLQEGSRASSRRAVHSFLTWLLALLIHNLVPYHIDRRCLLRHDYGAGIHNNSCLDCLRNLLWYILPLFSRLILDLWFGLIRGVEVHLLAGLIGALRGWSTMFHLWLAMMVILVGKWLRLLSLISDLKTIPWAILCTFNKGLTAC